MTISNEQKIQFQEKITTAPAAIQPLAAALLQYMDKRHYTIEQQINARTLEELFTGPFFDVLVLFSSPERALTIKTLALRYDATMFQTGPMRRSFRSAQPVQDNLYQYLQLIEEMLTFEEINLEELLLNRAHYEHGSYPNYNAFVLKKDNQKAMSFIVFEQMIAHELSLNNPVITEAVEEILFDEHQGNFFGHPLIRAIFKSTNGDMHEALGKLLLAAARQEGLRQAIVENIDHGSLDAQLTIMKLIKEHKLTRFSSVIRAIDTWMGLGYNSFENQKVTEEVLSLAIQAIEDDHFIEQLLTSDRTIDIYVALWAMSTKDYLQLEGFLPKLLKREKHIQLTTLAFLNNLSKTSFTAQFVTELILTTQDLELFTFAWASFLHARNYMNNDYAYDNDWRKDLHDFMQEHIQLNGIERQLFEQLEWVKSSISKDGMTIVGKPLSFIHMHLSFEDVVSTQIILAHHLEDETLFQRIIATADTYPPASRIGLLNVYCQDHDTEDKRNFLFSSLRDRSSTNRALALKKIKLLSPTNEEILKIEDLLTNKSGSLRKEAISLLKLQPLEAILQSAERLVQNSKQLKRIGGIELLLEASKEYELPNDKLTSLCSLLPKVTANEQVLLDQLLAQDLPEYNETNGFGLYTPQPAIQYNSISDIDIDMNRIEAWQQLVPLYLPESRSSGTFMTKLTKLFDNQADQQPLEAFFAYDTSKLLQKLEQLIQLLDAHAHYEYETYYWDETVVATTLGNDFRIVAAKTEKVTNPSLDVHPLPEDIIKWIQETKFSTEDIAYFTFYSGLSDYPAAADISEQVQAVIRPFFDYAHLKATVMQFNNLKYQRTIERILALLTQKVDKISAPTQLHEKALALTKQHSPHFNSFKQAIGIMLQLLQQIPAEQWQLKVNENAYYYGGTSSLLNLDIIQMFFDRSQDDYQTYGEYVKTLAINEEVAKRVQTTGYSPTVYKLTLHQYIDAIDVGLFTEDHLFEAIFTDTLASEVFNTPDKLIERYQPTFDDLSSLLAVRERAIDRILDIELMRGDIPTAVTKLTSRISHLDGIDYFLRILQALEGEKLARGYIWSAETKKDVFSRLLANCYPKEHETAQQLKEAWGKTTISTERLIEAMMYNQYWIDLVSEVINWEGLKESAWYFIAHTTDSLSNFAGDQIALFSNITTADFRDGAFDLTWFQSAYHTLGAKNFKLVYDAAKYASEEANHRRAQLYADTAIGKLSAKPLMAEIQDKRNKDKLRALGLIPLAKSDEKDALTRYQFIQNFLKESKQFGAQRRTSEARAANIALENLARNAGDGEITRFTWRMELFAFTAMKHLFEPRQIEHISAQLQIAEDASVSIKIEKDSKSLKNIPAALKKHEQILELQEAKKALSEQSKRARPALEQAMELETEFYAEELINLLAHPILAPFLQKIIFKNGEDFGLLTADGLKLLSAEVLSLAPSAPLKIAHPYHLLQSGQWRDWQAYMFEHKIKQPFKQVFRELYIVNTDEQGQKKSLRYAGHQINPSQAVALLKTRGWQVSYDDGPRKVYYKQNIVASLYAQADWFTPADVEAPAIEGVYFYNRLTGERLVLDAIPATIFSEIMRDLDLVVSVAHVGGVDPEASHSTIDMRSVIVEELSKLLKLSNVIVKKQHALIEGKLASYSLHLGSGVVHQVGGSMIPIIAVPSQHRGRIFLPMVDEDPRTAEILSKILLLSEDIKIKDPAILSHIRSYEQNTPTTS